MRASCESSRTSSPGTPEGVASWLIRAQEMLKTMYAGINVLRKNIGTAVRAVVSLRCSRNALLHQSLLRAFTCVMSCTILDPQDKL